MNYSVYLQLVDFTPTPVFMLLSQYGNHSIRSSIRAPRKQVYVLYLKRLALLHAAIGCGTRHCNQVYLSGGRPLFVLSDAQQEEVIAQADSHLKTAKGRGYRRQITRAEVSDLFSGLPRDAAGLVSFHDAQKLILGYREKQIARFRVIFPDTVTKHGKKRLRDDA